MQKYSKPIFPIPIYMQKLRTDLSVIWGIGKSYFYLIHRKNPTKEIYRQSERRIGSSSYRLSRNKVR